LNCIVNSSLLKSLVAKLFGALGVPDNSASLAADVLVTADLRGISSHRCIRLPKLYAPLLKRGSISPTTQLNCLASLGALQKFDANMGLGLALAPLAMEAAISSGKQYGVGLV
jgi:LDH2 family malate/lactate/ureidoglycolate dehydrogenase